MPGRCVLRVGCCFFLLISVARGQATQPTGGKQALIKVSVLKITRDATRADSKGIVLNSIMDSATANLIAALDKQGKVQVLSRPYLLALDKQPASISLGPNGIMMGSEQSPATQPAGAALAEGEWSLKLDLVPDIRTNGMIEMEVSSNFIAAQTPPNLQPRPAAPLVTTVGSKTRLLTGAGQSILIRANRQQQENSVSELLIIVTPTVAASADAG